MNCLEIPRTCSFTTGLFRHKNKNILFCRFNPIYDYIFFFPGVDVSVILNVGKCKVKGEKWLKYIPKFGGSAFDDANCSAHFDT